MPRGRGIMCGSRVWCFCLDGALGFFRLLHLAKRPCLAVSCLCPLCEDALVAALLSV